MQFLAQVMPGDLGLDDWRDVLSVFLCQNDPGLCEEWDPAAGGNQALLFPPAGLQAAVVPPGPATVLGEVSAVRCVTADGDYAEARLGLGRARGPSRGDVLGQLGGQPSWVQGDETPACTGCATPMSFAVQLEEGRDYRTAANFGGVAADTGSPAARASRQPFSGSVKPRAGPRSAHEISA